MATQASDIHHRIHNLFCHRCKKWRDADYVGVEFICRSCGETIVCDECGQPLNLALEHEHVARGGHQVAVSDNGQDVRPRFVGRCSCGGSWVEEHCPMAMELLVAQHLDG
jgi:hypothetical protein